MQIQNSYVTNMQQTYKVDKTEPAQKQDKVDSNKHSYDNPMLDKRANTILDKIISEKGLSSEESRSIKMMMLVMMTEVRVDSNGKIIDEAPNKNPDMSQTAVAKRIDKLIENLELNLNGGDFPEKHNQLSEVATQLKTVRLPKNCTT